VRRTTRQPVRTRVEAHITISVEVRPTESIDKVRTCLSNLFSLRDEPQVVESQQEGIKLLVYETDDIHVLDKLRELLRRQQILDASRAQLLRSKSDNQLSFFLNKQVAYVGRVSFSAPVGESALGPIRVTIQSDAIDLIIDWLAPPTVGGRVVERVEIR